MNNLRTTIHKRGESGGTEIGWSALSQYARCPRQWALAELLPHPSGGTGLASRPGRALIVGTLVHAFLKGWYLSDPDNGHYSADAGFTELHEAKLLFSDDDITQTGYGKDTPLADAMDLCRRYAKECGADGPDPDIARFRVATDEEGPLVERYFKVDLGYNDYYLTTRIDTIGWAPGSDDIILIPEHKTCDVSKQMATIFDLALSGQLTIETWAIRSNLGHTGEIIPVINLIRKRAAAKDVCRIWEPQRRTPVDLEYFRQHIIRRLRRMDSDVAEYRALVEKGVPPLTAILTVFEAAPPRETCAGQGFKCFAYDLCSDIANAGAWLLGTDARFPKEEAA